MSSVSILILSQAVFIIIIIFFKQLSTFIAHVREYPNDYVINQVVSRKPNLPRDYLRLLQL